MTFFPGYFRLSKKSDRVYRFFVKGGSFPPGPPGPQGPAGPQGATGPAGAGVVDYDIAEVGTNVSFTDGQPIFKKTFNFDAGPSSTDPTIIDIDLGSAIKVIAHECWLDNGVFQVPVPSADVQIIVVNGVTAVLTTPGDFTGYTGSLTLYYYYPDA